MVRRIERHARLCAQPVRAEEERVEAPPVPIEPVRRPGRPVAHVLGGIVQLPGRLAVVRQGPLQGAQEQLIVLGAVVRLLHAPVTVLPLLRPGEMIADAIACLLQKAQNVFVRTGAQQRLPAGGVGALIMDIGRWLVRVAVDGFVCPPAQIIQEALAGVGQVVGGLDPAPVHGYPCSAILNV